LSLSEFCDWYRLSCCATAQRSNAVGSKRYCKSQYLVSIPSTKCVCGMFSPITCHLPRELVLVICPSVFKVRVWETTSGDHRPSGMRFQAVSYFNRLLIRHLTCCISFGYCITPLVPPNTINCPSITSVCEHFLRLTYTQIQSQLVPVDSESYLPNDITNTRIRHAP